MILQLPHHPGRSASRHRPTVNPGPGIRDLLAGRIAEPNLKLRDIAARIVTSVSGRPPPATHFDDS
jgi:hypothetical protein